MENIPTSDLPQADNIDLYECDCCDVSLIPIYSRKGRIKDFKCSRCGRLQSEDFVRVICSVDGFLFPINNKNK